MLYFTCRYCKTKFHVDSVYKKAIHISTCPANKNAKKSQKFVKSFLPKKSDFKFKKTKAPRSRDNVEPSFAEKFVIKHFEDKGVTGYVRELKISGFFADFAFRKYKVVLEIDGKQHKLEKAIIYDKRRDQIFKLKGWHTVRIDWCRNPKVMIKNLDHFVNTYLK